MREHFNKDIFRSNSVGAIVFNMLTFILPSLCSISWTFSTSSLKFLPITSRTRAYTFLSLKSSRAMDVLNHSERLKQTRRPTYHKDPYHQRLRFNLIKNWTIQWALRLDRFTKQQIFRNFLKHLQVLKYRRILWKYNPYRDETPASRDPRSLSFSLGI